MDALPAFRLLRARNVAEVLSAQAQLPGSRLLGGGTDLVVNIRRGIGDEPPGLIDVTGVQEMQGIDVGAESFRIGAAVRVSQVAEHRVLRERFAVLAEAAASVAGPTQRNMGTVGGNLCLDTRCLYYNQSEWWRAANDYCLKYKGSLCHVAPKSEMCYATFSGDLAPALLVLDGEVEVVSPRGARTEPVSALYTGDGQNYLTLEPGAFVSAVRGRLAPALRSGYDKIRVRRSIEYPLAGVAAVVGTEGEELSALRLAFTGTNPRPVLLEGTQELVGKPLDEGALDRLASLIRRQVMAMRTTFTSGHYRRKAAGVLARRLVRKLHRS